MINHPHPDPVAIEILGLDIHWYGILYLVGFAVAGLIAHFLIRRDSFSSLRGIVLTDLIAAASIGVIIGGRLGYVLFYNPVYYAQNPLEILFIWAGGMSFHGGLAGVVVSLWVLSRIHSISDVQKRIREDGDEREKEQYDKEDIEVLETVTSQKTIFLRLVDYAAVLTPPGLGLGRLGNFINAELPGRVTSPDLPWAMSFGHPDFLPRHPSQLYQMFIEGFILTALMLYLSRILRPPGWLAGVFLMAYAIGRFIVEFYREPDSHLGLIFWGLSMGQLLSVPMFLLGLLLMYRLKLEAWWRAVSAEDARLTIKQFLHRALIAEPDARWSQHEKLFAENFGEEENDSGSGLTRLFRNLFGGQEEEEVEYTDGRVRLTRQEKRRLKKKKRKR